MFHNLEPKSDYINYNILSHTFKTVKLNNFPYNTYKDVDKE